MDIMTDKDIKILIACEESQAVCIEFRKLGFSAFSCDILPASGGHPEWHIEGDVLMAINGWFDANEIINPNYGINFIEYEISKDGRWARSKDWEWDVMIAFPPCTHLALSGSMHFVHKRDDGRQQEAIDFFMTLYNAPIKHIAIENPMGIIGGGDYIKEHFPELVKKYNLPIKYQQVVHPYFFGDGFEKTTCLWLKNLPLLFHAKSKDLFNDEITHVKSEERHYWRDKKTGKLKSQPMWYYQALLNTKSKEERSTLRSKTFPGIAKTMAKQWSEYLRQ